MKKLFLFITLILQIIVIGFLSQIIYTRLQVRRNILGSVNVSPINKNNLVASPSSELKYYYTLPVATKSSEFRYWEGSNGPLITYNYNNDGLNERFDYNVTKSDGVFRIITLGESFTYGSLVNTGDNWTEVMEDMLNKQNVCSNIKKVEVINLGVYAFDTPYIIKRFKDLGVKYNPDLIIWFESGTGFTRYNELERPLSLECQTKDATLSRSGNTNSDCWQDAAKQVLQNKKTMKTDELLENDLKVFLSSKGDTPFLFAGFSFPILSLNQIKILQKRINYGVNISSMLSVSNIYTKKGFLIGDGHPNEKGHKIVATNIFDYLIRNKQKFFRCN